MIVKNAAKSPKTNRIFKKEYSKASRMGKGFLVTSAYLLRFV